MTTLIPSMSDAARVYCRDKNPKHYLEHQKHKIATTIMSVIVPSRKKICCDEMSVSFTLLPHVSEEEDNAFLHTLSAKSDEMLHSIVASSFRLFRCDVRVVCEGVECSECNLRCVDDIIALVEAAHCQANRLVGFGSSVVAITIHADQLHQRHRLSAFNIECSLLLAHLWNLCKELERMHAWEWDVALMDAVPAGMCLAAVVACGQEERERRSLVEAGLWMFALFDSERAVQCFRNPGEENAGVIED